MPFFQMDAPRIANKVLAVLAQLGFEWRFDPQLFRIEARPSSTPHTAPHHGDGGGGSSAWDPDLRLKLNIYRDDGADAKGAKAGGSGTRQYILDMQRGAGEVCEFMRLCLVVVSLLKTRR